MFTRCISVRAATVLMCWHWSIAWGDLGALGCCGSFTNNSAFQIVGCRIKKFSFGQMTPCVNSCLRTFHLVRIIIPAASGLVGRPARTPPLALLALQQEVPGPRLASPPAAWQELNFRTRWPSGKNSAFALLSVIQ